MGVTWSEACTLCARSLTGARPPTAEEKRSRGRGGEQETDYSVGIYAIGQSEGTTSLVTGPYASHSDVSAPSHSL